MARKKVEAEATCMTISDLYPMPGSRKRRKRLGIGEGSGLGKTCGKGGKGQSMRSGATIPRGFEGGQMPLHRRTPKRGFTSRKKVAGENDFVVVSLAKLSTLPAGTVVNREILMQHGWIRNPKHRVKILGGSSLTAKLVVEADAFSLSAKSAIEGAGGEVRLLG